MIDFAAIFPFYLEIALKEANADLSGLVWPASVHPCRLSSIGRAAANQRVQAVIRIIRLTRVFRLFKLSKYSHGFKTVSAALSQVPRRCIVPCLCDWHRCVGAAMACSRPTRLVC